METAPFSQRYYQLALAFCPPQAGSARDLVQAYTRLFLGPGRPLAHPYESVYLEGQLMGAATAQVAAWYAQAGLRPAGERELPDHISVELAFMAHLAAREERNPPEGSPDRRRFLREHLGRWLPQFCQRVEASNAHPFYSEAARATRELVAADLARAGDPDRGPRLPHPRPVLHPQAARRHPLPGTGRRYPNIGLSLDPARCTLCTLCASACRPGALSAGCTPSTISLTFDPARCNGCRACLRLCPEKAVGIQRGAPLPAPVPGSRNVVAAASRVVCPRCNRPHIAEPWLERLAARMGGREAARRSLAFCPVCKTALDGDWPTPPATRYPPESFASV